VEQSASGFPSPGKPADPYWDEDTPQDMASLFDSSESPDALEGARRAVAQQRAKQKMNSIDWDVAAREEITALFGAKKDTSEPTRRTDSELESVRRAIAARKARSAPDAQNHHPEKAPVQHPRPGAPNFALDDEEDRGPRLDWLVDFIADDDPEGDKPARPPASPAPNTPRENQPEPRQQPPF
jgi:hypothetical protein